MKNGDKQQGGQGYDPSNFELIKRLLGLAWSYRGPCLVVIFLQFVITLFGLAGLGLTGLGIDYLRSVFDESITIEWPFGLAPPADWEPMRVLWTLGLAIVGIGIIHLFLFYAHQLSVAHLVHHKIVAGLRKTVYRQLQKLSFKFFDSNESGSIINRVTSDIQALRMFIDGVLLHLFTLAITLGVYMFYMLNIHVLLTLACLITIPALWVLSIWYSRKIRPMYLKNRILMDQLVLNFAEAVSGINTTKGFALEGREIDRFENANEAVRTQRQEIFRVNCFFKPTVEFLTQINLIILFLYGGHLAITGEIAVGTGLVVFARILQQFSNQITSIAEVADGVQQSLTGAKRVFEIMDADEDVYSKADAVSMPRAKGHLVFDNVCFGYSVDRAEDIAQAQKAVWSGNVLEGISFEIKPGEVVAIAGATGAGKTALLNLVPRFYDPLAGRITLDGHDLRDLNLQDLRRNIGFVFQENFLFSNSIRANIAFGYPEATQEQIERAARIACAHNFISEMPDGYDTLLGESGVNISGGQRQRIAIARALILDPAILLLDDPTTAIDPETEHEILEAMDRALQGRTTLIVAHRLSTLRRASRIIVLKRGDIVQSGAHEELMAMAGPYRNSIQIQEIDAESREIIQQLNAGKGGAS